MSITIRNRKVEKLVRQVARRLRESPQRAIRKSLQERLERLMARDAVPKSG
jgi:hypothetical protein